MPLTFLRGKGFMRINILQHTPNEGPGSILDWAHAHNHQVFVYHPYQFGYLPTVRETKMLIILGGPMSPNDKYPWIEKERQLIRELMDKDVPILGVCYGAQQIAKTLGYSVSKAPAKEVGWAPVYRKSTVIPGLPKELLVLHWHEEMFEIPQQAELLFSSNELKNQGFIIDHCVVGLQFHLEPQADNVREMVINDSAFIKNSVLNQSADSILETAVPRENQETMFTILDYLNKQ